MKLVYFRSDTNREAMSFIISPLGPPVALAWLKKYMQMNYKLGDWNA